MCNSFRAAMPSTAWTAYRWLPGLSDISFSSINDSLIKIKWIKLAFPVQRSGSPSNKNKALGTTENPTFHKQYSISISQRFLGALRNLTSKNFSFFNCMTLHWNFDLKVPFSIDGTQTEAAPWSLSWLKF